MLSLLACGWRRSVTGRLLRNVSHFVNHRVVVSQTISFIQTLWATSLSKASSTHLGNSSQQVITSMLKSSKLSPAISTVAFLKWWGHRICEAVSLAALHDGFIPWFRDPHMVSSLKVRTMFSEATNIRSRL